MKHDFGRHLSCGRLAASLAAVALLAVTAPSWALSAALQRIGLEADQQGGAVLTLSLSKRVAQHIFRLQNPERLVIDLPDTRRQARLPQPPEGAVVAAVRSGVHESGRPLFSFPRVHRDFVRRKPGLTAPYGVG